MAISIIPNKVNNTRGSEADFLKESLVNKYKNRTVFIGIDVHRKSYSLSCICEGVVVKRLKIKADPESLIQLIKKSFGEANIKTVYESGFSGFSLHRKLVESGIDNIVIHAASLAMKVSDRVKTDSKDSKKLAEQLAAGMLESINIPSVELEFSRIFQRTRSQLVKTRSRTMNQIRMKLLLFGLMPIDYDQTITRTFVKKLLPSLPPELKISIEIHLEHWEHVQIQILKLEKQIRTQIKEHPLYHWYRKVVGVGPITAIVLISELGDMSQFKNERALFSFTGLTPREYSSGEKKRLGGISKKGNPRIRHVLIELAWRAIRKDKLLNEQYLSIASRAGKKRAIVAIARKLIGIIRSIITNKTEYMVNYTVA